MAQALKHIWFLYKSPSPKNRFTTKPLPLEWRKRLSSALIQTDTNNDRVLIFYAVPLEVWQARPQSNLLSKGKILKSKPRLR